MEFAGLPKKTQKKNPPVNQVFLEDSDEGEDDNRMDSDVEEVFMDAIGDIQEAEDRLN